MARVIYPTDIEFSGPWLIDQERLEELDKIIDDEWPKLLLYKEKLIRERASKIAADKNDVANLDKYIEDLSRPNPWDFQGRTIIIYFKSGNKMEVSSFREALTEQTIKAEIARGFALTLKCVDFELTFTLAKSLYGDTLNLSYRNEFPGVTKELIYKINKWITSVKLPKWVSIWREEVCPFHWFVALMACIIMLSITVNHIPEKSAAYNSSLKIEAEKILKEGINKNNERRALEILLSKSTNYIPKDYDTYDPRYIKIIKIEAFVILLVIILCIALSFPPKSCVGIAQGEAIVRRWKRWLKIVSVTVPGLLVTGLIMPFIYNYIKSVF